MGFRARNIHHVLRRLHRFINELAFGNRLSEEIIIGIDDINRYYDEKKYRNAFFGQRFLPKDPSAQLNTLSEGECVKVKLVKMIVFDVRFIEDVEKCKTQKDQIYLLSITMLHEMIHQYCFENGIKDEGDHDDGWYEIAKQHGLEHGISDDGQSWESIDQWKTYWLTIYFRLR